MDAADAIDAVIDGCPSVTASGADTVISYPFDFDFSPQFNAALAAFVEASRDLIDLFDDDPSPVRVGRREVYPNESGRPAVRDASRVQGGAHCSA